MRLFGLLAWYDEEPWTLRRAIQSCAGTVTHLIAIDGPYATYPHTSKRSPIDQSQAIIAECRQLGIECIMTPPAVWYNEGVKRTALFQVAEHHGTLGQDWVLPIDADEELQNTEDLNTWLQSDPSESRAAFWYLTVPNLSMTPEERDVTIRGTETRSYAQTRLLRLSPGMHVRQPTHWQFADLNGPLSHAQYTFPPDSFHIRHHTLHRSPARKQAKAEHVHRRTLRGEH